MKRYSFLLALLLLLGNTTQAQWFDWGYAHSSFDSTYFNNTPSWLTQDTCAAPLWQIGASHKNVFANNTGISTDTINPVSTNQNHFFEIKVPDGSYSLTTFSFEHKMQANPLHAGGYITYYSPKDSLWHPIMLPNNKWDNTGAAYVNTQNLYSTNDTLFNRHCGYTRQDTSWQLSYVQLRWFVPAKGAGWSFQDFDTTRFRFHFISDTCSNIGDGWMIRKITLISVLTWGDVNNLDEINEFQCNELCENKLSVTVAMPVHGTLTLSNIAGQTVLQQAIESNRASLNTSELDNGMYILQLRDVSGKIFKAKKIVKLSQY